MSESLEAACGQYEQVTLAAMLRTAGVGRAAGTDPTSVDDDPDAPPPVDPSGDAFSQLVVQSLAGAIERAGGIGLRRALARTIGRERP